MLHVRDDCWQCKSFQIIHKNLQQHGQNSVLLGSLEYNKRVQAPLVKHG